MPTNEKEYNGYLFDQLSVLERLEKAHEDNRFEQEAEIIRNEITRKLYQKPPITSS